MTWTRTATSAITRVLRQEDPAPDANRDGWLQERRTLLQERMHKRRRRDLDGAASGLRKVLTLLGL